MKKTLINPANALRARGASLVFISIGALILTACSGPMVSRPGAVTSVPPPTQQSYQAYQESQRMAQAGITEASTLNAPPSEGAIGGHIGGGMDALDRGKMLKALDSPIGRPARWTNSMTKVAYTVTPTQKIEINQNPFCRRYHVVAQSGTGQREFDGTACISSDGNWHSAR